MNIKIDQAIVSGMKTTNRLKRRRILTVKEFRARFGDEDQSARYLARERWPNGFLCLRCGGRSRGYIASRRVEECAACGYQCSATAGTIFHKTRVPLTAWFWAIDRMGQDQKGISRYATEQGDRGLLSHGLVAAARKPRDGFRPIRSGSETFHRDRHHRLGFGSSSLLGIPLFGSARIAFIDFDEATQLITLIAVGHGLANLGKSGSSCFR
jgi:Transposase zinc-ribbon domain